jgi:hypothetical protein
MTAAFAISVCVEEGLWPSEVTFNLFSIEVVQQKCEPNDFDT